MMIDTCHFPIGDSPQEWVVMKGQFVNPEEEKSCNKFVTKDDCGGNKLWQKLVVVKVYCVKMWLKWWLVSTIKVAKKVNFVKGKEFEYHWLLIIIMVRRKGRLIMMMTTTLPMMMLLMTLMITMMKLSMTLMISIMKSTWGRLCKSVLLVPPGDCRYTLWIRASLPSSPFHHDKHHHDDHHSHHHHHDHHMIIIETSGLPFCDQQWHESVIQRARGTWRWGWRWWCWWWWCS